MNKFQLLSLVFACMVALPAAAQQKKPPAPATTQVANLQKQVKTLTDERDGIKQKMGEMMQENAELYRQLDEANGQKERTLEELEHANATLRENQSGGDSLLRDLQEARNQFRASASRVESLEKENAALQASLDNATNSDGALVHFGPHITPARCINLQRMTPKVKRATGLVVINCLIDEMGETIDVRLIQGLPGAETEWTAKAHEACLEAAKKLVFESATTSDGRRVKVWQGIGFNLK